MKKIIQPVSLVALMLLVACTSNFGDHRHAFLRNETDATLQQKIVENQTTAAEITAMFGPANIYTSKDGTPPKTCYRYYESHMPFYNFLPTNMLYMSSTSSSYQLCFDIRDGIVTDYQFEKTVKKKANSPAGSLVQDILD